MAVAGNVVTLNTGLTRYSSTVSQLSSYYYIETLHDHSKCYGLKCASTWTVRYAGVCKF